MSLHRQNVTEVLRALETSAAGLDPAEARRRLMVQGPNELREAPQPSRIAAFLAQFADFMVLVLLGAAVVSGLIGDIVDTIVIVAIVMVNAVIGFVQERRAETALRALRTLAAPSATVLRGGEARTVPAADLVSGDAVLLEAGNVVPADLRLVQAAGLRVDEAALTGESVPVDKSVEPLPHDDVPVAERHNVVHKGTHVLHGRGLGVVFATGMRTEFGRIAALLEHTQSVDTPLQRRLAQFGRRIALLVIAICIVVFAAGMLRGEAPLPMLLTALSLAVAAIPEALPAVVGVALALGARRLVARQALIRRLPAVEALGSVTCICTDKTGTLTANSLRAERFHCNGEALAAAGTAPPWQMLLIGTVLCNDASLAADGAATGDPTEVALLRAASAGGLDLRRTRAEWPRIDELPFDAARRLMTTLHGRPDGGWLAITKGAVEEVIARSVRELRGDSTVPIDREALADQAGRMAGDGLRVLGVALRRWATRPRLGEAEGTESDLVFVGMVGLIDPPRAEVPGAIADCHAAGITPIMITGDHPLTARAVAQRIGLLGGSEEVLSGADVAALSDERLAAQAADVRVYARTAPEQKLRIVQALQARGEVVAMTGDGVNDAPALQRADIGIAMGVIGTDVARQASGMVLLDDNFATIVRAVREGRRIYDNLRRFVRYVLTTNSGEIWTIFLAPFLGLPIPLLPIQILWINLVTDGLPGLALAMEPAERNVMRRAPRARDESLFAGGLGVHALLVGLLMAGIALGCAAWYLARGLPQWQTVTFTVLSFAQLGHVLAIRSEYTSLWALGLNSNRALSGSVALMVLMQLAVVYLPAGNALFSTVPLGPGDLALCFGAGLLVLAVVEAEKLARRRTGSGAAT